MILVELFSREDCHLCEDVLAVLRWVQREIPFALEERKLVAGDPFYESFNKKVPVVFINHEEAFHFGIDERVLGRRPLGLNP
jgi:glutaredoxin